MRLSRQRRVEDLDVQVLKNSPAYAAWDVSTVEDSAIANCVGGVLSSVLRVHVVDVTPPAAQIGSTVGDIDELLATWNQSAIAAITRYETY